MCCNPKTIWHVILAIFIFLCSSARADVCILKQGEYTLTGTPCNTADVADGAAQDNIINYVVYPSKAYTFDVVFDQRNYTNKAEIAGWQSKIKYDATVFADSATCEGTSCTKPACTVDPDSKFSLNPCTLFSLNCCQKIFTSTDGLGAGVYVWNQDAELTTAVTDNFVMTRIEFKSLSSSVSVGSVYDLVFDTGDESNGTFVQTVDLCNVLSEVCEDSGKNNFPTQATMTTRLAVTTFPCYAVKPGPATLTCRGIPPACITTSGDVVARLSYTLPTKCYYDGTLGECSGLSIKFTSTELGGTIVLDSSSPNPYERTIQDGVGYSIPALSIDSMANECGNSSTNTSSAYGGTTTSNVAYCACGQVPQISLNPTSFLNGTFIQNSPISIPAIVTLDSSLTIPDDIPSDGLMLYFTNNPTSSYYQSVNVRSTLKDDGTFTATIPGEYMTPGSNIYFCIVAKDSNMAEGKYPETCDISSVETLANTGAYLSIPDVPPNRFWFVEGQEPYPNQFPFSPSPETPLLIQFSLNDFPVNVTAQIYSLDGKLVRYLDYEPYIYLTSCSPGFDRECNICTQFGYASILNGCIWSGTSFSGNNNFVANGLYIINIHAVSTGNFRGSSFDYTKGVVVMR